MPALITILLFSLALSLILTLLTKVLTNQKAMRETKKNVASFRQQIKEAQKAGNTAEVKNLSDQMFKASKGQFKYSTRSMFVSMIVVIIAFGWLQANYDKIAVNFPQLSNQTNSTFVGTFKYEGKDHAIETGVGQDLYVDKALYKISEFIPFEGAYLKPSVNAGKPVLTIYPAKAPVEAPYIGSYLSWFWLYILITLPSTIIFRKLLDVE